ncbi:MAG: hypothetical protein KH116_17045 [Clostridium sp.]|nr:hypothetical protein [Clostridium sp.]
MILSREIRDRLKGIDSTYPIGVVLENVQAVMYVVTKNILECKNFIQDFVKEIVVYKTHGELVFNVGFNFVKSSKYVNGKRKLLLKLWE